MIESFSVKNEFLHFLASFGIGAAIAIIWVLANKIPLPKILRAVLDTILIIFQTTSTILISMLSFQINNVFLQVIFCLCGFISTLRILYKIFPKLKTMKEPDYEKIAAKKEKKRIEREKILKQKQEEKLKKQKLIEKQKKYKQAKNNEGIYYNIKKPNKKKSGYKYTFKALKTKTENNNKLKIAKSVKLEKKKIDISKNIFNLEKMPKK